MMQLRSTIKAAAAALALAAATMSSPALQAKEADWVFAGTVKIDTTQMAFIISGNYGGGKLEYQGKTYDFKIGGLGIGSVGVSTINAVGAVYNMDDVSKFPGTYVQSQAAATLGTKGTNIMRLSNEHGVIMELKASSKGAALTVGVEGIIVRMDK